MRAVIAKATNEMLGVEGATGVPAFNATVHRLVDIPPGWPAYSGWQVSGIDGAGFYPANPDEQVWDGKTWVDDPAKVEAHLVAEIDAAAGRARLQWLTMVPGQSDAYREKMVDVASLNALAGTTALILAALKLLTVAEQKARWPFLYAEMVASGLTTLVQARDAVSGAAAASRLARAEIERKRRAGKIAIRSAASAAAKRAAYAAINWNWTA